MSTEQRRGTNNKYVTRVERVGHRLRKRYLGRASDPCVRLLLRQRELMNADHIAAMARIHEEIERSRIAEVQLDEMVQAVTRLKLLSRIVEHQSVSNMTENNVATESLNFPGLHRFIRTCREAEAGNTKAQASLRSWLDSAPAMVGEATDLIAITKRQIVELAAGDSPETRALIQHRVESESQRLMHSLPDDPLTKLAADVVVTAWLDVLRCGVAEARHLEHRSANYWASAHSRSQTRFIKASSAFQRLVANQRRASRAAKPKR